MNLSLPPNVIKEATSTKFQVSLLLFIGTAFGAYYLGQKSTEPALALSRELGREAREESRQSCNQHVTTLTAICERAARDCAATQDRQMTIQNEVVELNSKVRKR